MKVLLREKIKAQLNSISAEEMKSSSSAIFANLKNHLKQESGTWLGYQNLSDEPLVDWSQVAPHLNWAFPVIRDCQIQATKPTDQFKKGAFGISEPSEGLPIDINQLSGVVAPALAFDKKGYRLGRGGGYYDKYLFNFKNKKIGLCFEKVLQEELPRESHDIQFDVVVTENKIYLKTTEGAQQWN